MTPISSIYISTSCHPPSATGYDFLSSLRRLHLGPHRFPTHWPHHHPNSRIPLLFHTLMCLVACARPRHPISLSVQPMHPSFSKAPYHMSLITHKCYTWPSVHMYAQASRACMQLSPLVGSAPRVVAC